MPKKVRSDKRVGKLEKDLGLPPGTVRNPSGRDTRSDKKVGTIRKEREKKQIGRSVLYERSFRCLIEQLLVLCKDAVVSWEIRSRQSSQMPEKKFCVL